MQSRQTQRNMLFIASPTVIMARTAPPFRRCSWGKLAVHKWIIEMTNPYESPTAADTHTYDPPVPEHEMARRFTRFAAALIDGFLTMAIVLPIQLYTGFTERALNRSNRSWSHLSAWPLI